MVDASSDERPITLLISAESRVDGQLLANALERSRRGFNVISCAFSQTELESEISAKTPDVALVSQDLQDGPLAGLHGLGKLRNASPQTRSVVLLKTHTQDLMIGAFRAGAKGVFFQSEPLSVLTKCIRCVHAGEIWAQRKHLDQVLESLVKTAPQALIGVTGRRLLTARQEEVMKLVAVGMSNREIAKELSITVHTVSNYLFHIYEKLGVSTRVELVLYSLSGNR